MVTGSPSAMHAAHKDRNIGGSGMLVLLTYCATCSMCCARWLCSFTGSDSHARKERQSLKKESSMISREGVKKKKRFVLTAAAETKPHFCDGALWTARRICAEPKWIQINFITASASSLREGWERESRLGSALESENTVWRCDMNLHLRIGRVQIRTPYV